MLNSISTYFLKLAPVKENYVLGKEELSACSVQSERGINYTSVVCIEYVLISL